MMAAYDEEERDQLSDLYETSDTGDTPGTSDGRSATSEERSVTPETAETTSEGDTDEIKEEPRPKCIVFDLDYTLWPFWVDRRINVELPFKSVDGRVHDATGRELKSFPDITDMLIRLKMEGYQLGIASEAFYKEEVANLVKLFGWDDCFDYQEIYPGSKIFHFVNIKRQSGINFPDMLYFDDEKENLSEVSGTCTGITTVWADRGVSDELVEEALQKFAENRQSNTYYRSKPVTISRRNSSEPFQSMRETINMKRRNSIEAQQNMFGPLACGNYKPSLIQAQQKEHGVGHRPSMGQSQHGEKPIGGPLGFKPRRRFSIM